MCTIVSTRGSREHGAFRGSDKKTEGKIPTLRETDLVLEKNIISIILEEMNSEHKTHNKGDEVP